MKTLIMILLILSLPFTSIAKEKKKNNFLICKQKQIPFEVSTNAVQNVLEIKLRAETTVDDFSIINVRGLDTITIDRFQPINNLNIAHGETIDTQVEYSNLKGMAFIVLDVEYLDKGIRNKKNIPIPVGTLSSEQKAERKKHVKTIKIRRHTLDSKGNSKATNQTTTENVHYMKID